MTAFMVNLNGFDIDPIAGLVYGPKGKPIGSKDTSGYLQVDGRTRGYGIQSAHQLVWVAANGPIPPGFEVNHKNGVKTDNRLANLELLTHQNNILHAYRTGLKSNHGDLHPNRKLCSTDVREIRRREREGVSHQKLASQFGVTRRTVNHIVNRVTWTSVGD